MKFQSKRQEFGLEFLEADHAIDGYANHLNIRFGCTRGLDLPQLQSNIWLLSVRLLTRTLPVLSCLRELMVNNVTLFDNELYPATAFPPQKNL